MNTDFTCKIRTSRATNIRKSVIVNIVAPGNDPRNVSQIPALFEKLSASLCAHHARRIHDVRVGSLRFQPPLRRGCKTGDYAAASGFVGAYTVNSHCQEDGGSRDDWLTRRVRIRPRLTPLLTDPLTILIAGHRGALGSPQSLARSAASVSCGNFGDHARYALKQTPTKLTNNESH